MKKKTKKDLLVEKYVLLLQENITMNAPAGEKEVFYKQRDWEFILNDDSDLHTELNSLFDKAALKNFIVTRTAVDIKKQRIRFKDAKEKSTLLRGIIDEFIKSEIARFAVKPKSNN